MKTSTPNSWGTAFEEMLRRAPLQHAPANITLIVFDLPDGMAIKQDTSDTVVVPIWAYRFCMRSLMETYHLRSFKEQPGTWAVGPDGTRCLYRAITFEVQPRPKGLPYDIH